MARTQTNRIAKNVVREDRVKIEVRLEKLKEKNTAVVRRLMKIMFMYSVMKIRANLPALYSMLNPETSSDSPSAKSNGVRLVSAKMEVNHIIRRGMGSVALIDRDVEVMSEKFSVV